MDNITFDYYSLNFINAAITSYILIIGLVFFTVFFKQYGEHKDKVGLFLLGLSVALVIYPALRVAIQLGQGLGLSGYRLEFALLSFVTNIVVAIGYTVGIVLYILINNDRTS